MAQPPAQSPELFATGIISWQHFVTLHYTHAKDLTDLHAYQLALIWLASVYDATEAKVTDSHKASQLHTEKAIP